MKRILMLGGIMLLIAGCGTTVPIEETSLDVVDTSTDSQVVMMETAYQFVFPGTGWYMDFEYVDGFTVNEEEGRLVFDLLDGKTIVFDYDNTAQALTDGEEYVGNGWWGQQSSGQFAFTTPDNKYHVLISGEDEDVLDTFVKGMTLGK